MSVVPTTAPVLYRGLRARAGEDDGAAMILVLIAMLTASSLSLLILGTLVAGRTPTILNRKNIRTVHAAEAGVDIALGRIRAAQMQDPANPTDPTATVGDKRLLPCIAGQKYGSLQGAVDGSPGALTYAVTVSYFSEDPAGKADSWRATNALACSASGQGPVLTPRYAVLRSTGGGQGVPGLASTAGDRSMETIYDFHLTNTNVSGGLIHNYYDGNAASLDLCFDAGSGNPTAGTQLRVQACVPGQESQLWAWRKNFTIGLASTQTETLLSGMCVTLDIPGTGTAYLTLEPCDGLAHQQWGYNDNAHFQARPRYPTSSTAYCPVIETDNTAGSKVYGSTTRCGDVSRASTWRPEAKVGAGSVGDVGNDVIEKPMQWVNFYEFGRCYDISNWDVGYVSMIAYPCKQDPTAYVGWNQTMVWQAGTNGWIYTYGWNGGTTYVQAKAANPGNRVCITSPTALGGYVRMTGCVTGSSTQRWIVNRELVGDYANSYTVVDSRGRCLSIGPPNLTQSNEAIKQWSSIIVDTCDGSTKQKWNAPPDAAPATTRDTREFG
jgi:hypothetical protein